MAAEAQNDDFDPELAYDEDFDEGGFYTWHTALEFRVRRADGLVMRAGVYADEGPRVRWEVELIEADDRAQMLEDGEMTSIEDGKTAAMAALQRHGYEPRRPGA